MGASLAEIAQLRRMVAEPTTTTYSDAQITAFIELYPMLDVNGALPTTWVEAGDEETANPDWIAVYNLNLAAADIWEEKAAAVASKFDFGPSGSSFKQSQLSTQYLKMAETYRNRRVNGWRPA